MTIGVFDSGLGGLLTARYIKAFAPEVRILYYGDTAHLPYGDKSSWQVQAYAREIVRFLLEAGAQGIVIACNTASAVAREVVWTEARGKPVWDAISATLQQFEAQPPEFPLGVIGTYTTIRSGIYGAAIRERWPEAPIAQLPTPLLVPLIEEGFADHPATQLILQTYLSSPALRGIRSLLLACTHYPLLIEAIEAYYRGCSEACRLYNSRRCWLALWFRSYGGFRPCLQMQGVMFSGFRIIRIDLRSWQPVSGGRLSPSKKPLLSSAPKEKGAA
jgi:glutamate racemase